jgi:hypothetical protein
VVDISREHSRGGQGLDVDLSESPRFIRFTLSGEWPILTAQREAIPETLVAKGKMTRATRALIDLRQIESGAADTPVPARHALIARVQAFLVATFEQHQLARQIRHAAPSGTTIEIFLDEKEALQWLWNSDPDW